MKKIKIQSLLFYGMVVVAVLWNLWLQLPGHDFRVSFLDVGQGDAIFIKTPGNFQMLVDGGPKNEVMQRLGELMPFFDRSIDVLILTHPHDDHMEGLVEVLNRYGVKQLMISGVVENNKTYFELLKVARARGTEIVFVDSESDFVKDGVFFDFLYPQKFIIGDFYSNQNNSSVVMKISYRGRQILLTGDLEEEGEKELLAAGIDLSADILKSGHHGSNTSSSWEFLKAIDPQIVVIQVGTDNDYGHPVPATVREYYRLGVEKIYRTDLDSTVEFSFN